VQRNVFRKLRRGEYLIEQELDLHGHRVLQARETLVQFLRDARIQGHRCVRIVHGKGLRSPAKKSVLKQKVHHWLKQRDEILAFCTARSFDGGTGAIYVLLKRK
jgi:DNA-nicking Smr family endonuclease